MVRLPYHLSAVTQATALAQRVSDALPRGLLGLARHTDAGDLLLLADEYQGRDDYGQYNNGQDAFNAVRCVDAPTPTDPSQDHVQHLSHTSVDAPRTHRGLPSLLVAALAAVSLAVALVPATPAAAQEDGGSSLAELQKKGFQRVKVDGKVLETPAFVVTDKSVIEVDGKPLPSAASSEFYLAPGAHRFTVEWHPCPGGLCTSSGVYAERPRTACFSTQAGGRYRVSARNPGHLALASWTRFSPNTRCPAAITGRISSAEKVFDTATSRTEAGSRPARPAAACMRVRTASRRRPMRSCSSLTRRAA